jgi:hypothetical protein
MKLLNNNKMKDKYTLQEIVLDLVEVLIEIFQVNLKVKKFVKNQIEKPTFE